MDASSSLLLSLDAHNRVDDYSGTLGFLPVQPTFRSVDESTDLHIYIIIHMCNIYVGPL